MPNNIDLRGRALPALELRPGSDASFGLTLNNVDLLGLTVVARIGSHALTVGEPDADTGRMVVLIPRTVTAALGPVESLSIFLIDADGLITSLAYGSVLSDTERPMPTVTGAP
jgi:hypothetical protein